VTDYLKKVLNQINNFISGLSPVKKVSMVIIGFVIITSFVGLFYWAGKKSYKPLMTNLSAEDSTAIIRVLREKKIPFKVDKNGKNIYIPPESVYDLRLELATVGLPDSSVSGYEIFDTQSLGTTSFVQNINKKRALEGELMRTINTIKSIKKSRVHLAIPKKSAFVEDQKEPKASVVLDLVPGRRISEKQVSGIGRLISSAVEGLDINKVVIVDSTGKTLSVNRHDNIIGITSDQLDFKRKIENRYEKRIEELLTPIVGEGKVVARVTADLDFSQVSETQTIYDPDGSAVRSIHRNNQSMNGTRPSPYGKPGAITNSPELEGMNQEVNNQIKTGSNKINETTNYEVPKIIRQTRRPTGVVSKLSVAVVLNGKTVRTEDDDGKTVTKTEKWTDGKIQEFRGLIEKTVGVNLKRGDVVDIKNMEFLTEDFEEANRLIRESERREYIKNLTLYSVIGIIIILFFLFVVRPFIKWITENTVESVDTFLPQTIEELEKMQKNSSLPGLEDTLPVIPEKVDPEKVEGEMIKEKIVTLVDSNPHKAALILRDWIKQEAKKDKQIDDSEELA